MAKHHALLFERHPVRDRPGALLVTVAALGVWLGCFIGQDPAGSRPVSWQQPRAASLAAPAGCEMPPADWPALPSSKVALPRDAESLLAPFFSCTSPAEFVALQRRVDMARLMRALDDWSAVRLGSLGPVLPEAAGVLNHKRATFLVNATQQYSVGQAEIFTLFVINTSFDKDIEKVLRILSEERRVGQTWGRMATAREQLRRRGVHLADFPDRPERALRDSGRGALEAAAEVLTAMPMSQTGTEWEYLARKRQLPPPYQQALDETERSLAETALTPGHVLQGLLDEMTFGAPLGLYHLATGFGHGVHSLARGEYEQATRELTPAALLVACYASGKGVRALSKSRGASGTSMDWGPRLEEWKATAERLRGKWGSGGLQDLARYLRADPEAALLVAEGGEAGAAALHEARGNVPKAQVWFSEAKSDRSGASPTRGGAGRRQGGVTSLADDAAGLSREALETKLLQLELETPGPRLSGNLAVLEEQLSALERSPPFGALGDSLWSEYLEYGRRRFAELRQGAQARKGRTLEPPLKWEGYQQLRSLWLRGLTFERGMAKLLRDDAALPRARRRFLQDFEDPRVETYVGVRKPTTELRFADVLVIEQKPLPGQPPRVETFSLKSRDFSGLPYETIEAQMNADAREALAKYGETLDIRRPGLEVRAEVQRVRLIYEGGPLRSKKKDMQNATSATEQDVRGVEVLFQ